MLSVVHLISETHRFAKIEKHAHKTKDRVTLILYKTGGKLRSSGRVSSSYTTSGTRRVSLVTNPVISHELGKDTTDSSN